MDHLHAPRRRSIVLSDRIEHPLRRRHDYVGQFESFRNDTRVPGKPRGVRYWIVVNSLPPTDYIAVCHHEFWNSALQHSVIKLVEVQNVRSGGGYDLLQILRGFR